MRGGEKKYYGVEKGGFIQGERERIDCELGGDKIKGIRIEGVKLCCWKVERSWERGIFRREKRYIEEISEKDLIGVDEGQNEIKCGGMGEKWKDLFKK